MYVGNMGSRSFYAVFVDKRTSFPQRNSRTSRFALKPLQDQLGEVRTKTRRAIINGEVGRPSDHPVM